MLISDLEQLEVLSEDNLIRGGLVFSLSPIGSISLTTDQGEVLVSEQLNKGEPVTSNFSTGNLRGTLTTLFDEGVGFTWQSVALNGVAEDGGFAFASNVVKANS